MSQQQKTGWRLQKKQRTIPLNSGKGRDSQTLTTASSEGNYLQVAQRMTENQAEFLKFELEEGDQMTRFESETDQELISELVEAKHKYSDEGELHVTTEKSGATTSPNLERKNQGHKILGSNNSLNGSDITQGRKDDYQFNPKNGSHVRQRGRSFDDFFNYPDGSQETYVDLEFLQAHGQSYEEPEVKIPDRQWFRVRRHVSPELRGSIRLYFLWIGICRCRKSEPFVHPF